MKISCIFGHKWDGCKCERCGQLRDEGHRFEYYYYNYSREKCCGQCERCGKHHELPHDYQPFDRPCHKKCSRCGHIIETEHDFQAVPGKCVERCTVCGKERNLPHTWKKVEGKCRDVCAVCGKEGPADTAVHTWARVPGKCVERCTVCGEEHNLPHTWKKVEGKCRKVCEVCRKEGPVEHTWASAPGRCVDTCTVCGETRHVKHRYKNGKCERCGRSIEEPENHSIPPLLWAAVEGDVSTVRELIAGGADVNRYGPDETPLIAAARKGYDDKHREVVRLLLDAGANINAKDMYGRTATQNAARKGLGAMVQYLMSRGGI